MLLYDALADWYPLVDPLSDHEDEAAMLAGLLAARGITGGTLLELGSGAGNNAHYLAASFACTLVEPSAAMRALSQRQNPSAEHVDGDMRTVRLGRAFDVVLVHDAVCYLVTEAELRALAATLHAHLRPGGVALVSPDTTRESFHEATDETLRAEGERTLFFTEWDWDPDPTDTRYSVEFVFQLREGGVVRVVHDPHEEGLFSVDTWLAALGSTGLDVTAVACREEEVAGTPFTPLVFVVQRPA